MTVTSVTGMMGDRCDKGQEKRRVMGQVTGMAASRCGSDNDSDRRDSDNDRRDTDRCDSAR